MRVLDDCEMSSRGRGYYGSTSSHGIKDSIEALMRSLEDRILGLHLIPFLPQTGKRSKKDKKRQARMDKKVGKQQGES
jgi:hypothetical protein